MSAATDWASEPIEVVSLARALRGGWDRDVTSVHVDPDCGVGPSLVVDRWQGTLDDLADAARRVPDDGAVHSDDGNHKAFPTCARCGLEWPCPTAAIRDALARLDGGDS